MRIRRPALTWNTWVRVRNDRMGFQALVKTQRNPTSRVGFRVLLTRAKTHPTFVPPWEILQKSRDISKHVIRSRPVMLDLPKMKRSVPKPYVNKPYKNPRRGTTMTERKRITQIARSVVLQAAETKLYVSQTSQNVNDNGAVAINLTSGIATGADSVSRIGTKVHLQGIRIRGLFYSNPASGTATKTFRFTLIKANQKLTSTISGITLTDVFKVGTTATIDTAHVDLKKVRILHDEVMITTPRYSAAAVQTMLQPFDFYTKIGKSEIYESDTSVYITTGNYYLIIAAYDGNGVASPGGFNIAYTVNFKDE